MVHQPPTPKAQTAEFGEEVQGAGGEAGAVGHAQGEVLVGGGQIGWGVWVEAEGVGVWNGTGGLFALFGAGAALLVNVSGAVDGLGGCAVVLVATALWRGIWLLF